jgi:hypothetical protein
MPMLKILYNIILCLDQFILIKIIQYLIWIKYSMEKNVRVFYVIYIYIYI